MEIIHNQNPARKNSFSHVRGSKNTSDILRDAEKDLLGQMAQTLTLIYGGEIKSRRGMTA